MSSALAGHGAERGEPAGGVAGVGVDLASISEVRQAIRDAGERYLNRVFTPGELERCARRADPAPLLAAILALKEAALKAIGVAKANAPWTCIDAQQQPGGRWHLDLSGIAAQLAAQREVEEFALSVSYDGDLATATVIATRSRNLR